MTPDKPAGHPIVFFDGVCGMCNALVNFLVRVDASHSLRFAPLQGETANRERATHPEIPNDLRSMAFLDKNGVAYIRMKGVAQCAKYLPWPWKFGYVVFFVPGWMSNPFYDFIASIRYRLFGKHDVCRIPQAHERELFLP